MIYANI